MKSFKEYNKNQLNEFLGTAALIGGGLGALYLAGKHGLIGKTGRALKTAHGKLKSSGVYSGAGKLLSAPVTIPAGIVGSVANAIHGGYHGGRYHSSRDYDRGKESARRESEYKDREERRRAAKQKIDEHKEILKNHSEALGFSNMGAYHHFMDHVMRDTGHADVHPRSGIAIDRRKRGTVKWDGTDVSHPSLRVQSGEEHQRAFESYRYLKDKGHI